MKSTILASTRNYRLVTFGFAIELLCKLTGESVYLQGDDADWFMDQLAALEAHAPYAPTEQHLAAMWDEYNVLAERAAA